MTEREEIIERRRTTDGLESRRVVENRVDPRRVFVSRVNALIWLIFSVIIGLIAIRVVLRLIAANPQNAFANFIYDLTDIFLAPFFGLTGTPATDTGMVLEIPAVIAMFVYALVALALVTLIRILFDSTGGSRVVQRVRRTRD